MATVGLSSSAPLEPETADFAIYIDFDRGSERPQRIFQAVDGLITAFQRLDRVLAGSIDSSIEPVLVLEDIEAGSLKVWLRDKLLLTEDQALLTLDWKPLVGKYLVAAKYAFVRWVNDHDERSRPGSLADLRQHFLALAKETDIQRIAAYGVPSAADILSSAGDVAQALMPEPRRLPFSGQPVAPGPPPMQLASAAMPERHGETPAADALAPPLTRRSKRLELSTWAMTRGKPGQILGPNSLAANGATLGGSQAGARMTYWIDRHLGASLRVSTPLGGARGGEAALGVRYRPFLTIPFAITAERRQRFGRAGGRNDFALFAEGGIWDQPMPAGFRLNAYAQAGVVGIKSPDPFGDGAFTLTRPLWRNISGGSGCGAGRSRTSTGSTPGRA